MNRVLLHDRKFTYSMLTKTFNDIANIEEEPPVKCDLLIRWGSVKGEDTEARIVLNRKTPLKNCLDKEKTFDILRINRIRRPRFVIPSPDSPYPLIGKKFNSCGKSDERIVQNYQEAIFSGANFFVEHLNLLKKYNIYVFDCNVFYLTKKIPVKTNSDKISNHWEYEEVPKDLDYETLKVCSFAQRAVYILGLDFALIHAGIDLRNRPVVLDVTPVPQIPAPALKKFAKMIREYPGINELDSGLPAALLNQSEPDVLLGADPEFVLRDTQTGNMIYPSDYLSKEGPIGYDERSERRQGLLYPLAEVRPKPDYCPIRLTDNIYFLLRKAASILPPKVEWLAGSTHFGQYYVGGHIHFSNINLNYRLLRALDNYLGIPLFLIEDPATSVLRRRQYGWIGSFRYKNHGGFEYRTPGSWLVSPDIARATLCLAKIISSEYPKLTRDVFTDTSLQKAFYQGKNFYFYDIFSELWEDLKKTTLFSKYYNYLAPLANKIEIGDHWDENQDIRKSWGLI